MKTTLHFDYRYEDGVWWGSCDESRWVGQPSPPTLEKLREIAREAASLHFSDWESLEGADSLRFFALTKPYEGEPYGHEDFAHTRKKD